MVDTVEVMVMVVLIGMVEVVSYFHLKALMSSDFFRST